MNILTYTHYRKIGSKGFRLVIIETQPKITARHTMKEKRNSRLIYMLFNILLIIRKK